MDEIKLWTDGGSRGNPGKAAYGYVVKRAGIILEKCGNYVGITTNNQAEYQGLIDGVKWVLGNHPKSKVTIHMDSLLIVNQVKGIYKIKNAALIPMHQEVKRLLTELPSWSIRYVPRAENAEADSLVNQTLDSLS
jgi:ribonuclease HI